VIYKHERIIHGNVASEHIVQLFDTTSSLATAVADFLGKGVAEDARLIVIARAPHWTESALQLEIGGVQVADMIAQRQLMVFDAATTLAGFYRNDRIDPDLFDKTVGDLIRQQALFGPLRIYGEIVDLLAERGLYAEAEALEHLWDGLSQECSLRLLCGYLSSRFTDPATASVMSSICAAHTSVRSSGDDPVASWVLAERGARCSTH
jgi:MEDS: MEthanogen/methylotroph, DcmR Sensory domain